MCSTSCSCDVACAPTRARCWKQPGPGASTGTSPKSGGPAKPSDSAIALGTASHKGTPDSSTVRSTIARATKPWNFLKRRPRRKARGAFRPYRARNCTWGSYGPFQGQKGLIPPSAHHIKKITHILFCGIIYVGCWPPMLWRCLGKGPFLECLATPRRICCFWIQQC